MKQNALQLFSDDFDPRRFSGRPLRLSSTAKDGAKVEVEVTVHGLSAQGILIEAAAEDLGIGDNLEMNLPAGAVRTKVVWESGNFLGCKFEEPLSSGAISAALLRAAPDGQGRDVEEPTTAFPISLLEEHPARGLKPEKTFFAATMLTLSLWSALGGAVYLLL